MKGKELLFRFGEAGTVPVVLFHPPLTGGKWADEHLLFVPPQGCTDLGPYEKMLDEEATVRNAMLYALKFSGAVPGQRLTFGKEIALAQAALLHLRAGCEHLQVCVSSFASLMFMRSSPHFRHGRDDVTILR